MFSPAKSIGAASLHRPCSTNTFYDVTQWVGNTQNLISEADERKRGATVIRNVARSTSRLATKNMREDTSHVDEMLHQRVQSTRTLLRKVQLSLQNVQEEKARLQGSRTKALAAIRRCRVPITVAEVRASHRTRKPPLENISDDVEKALNVETVDLAQYVDGVMARVAQADGLLEKMTLCIEALTQDAQDKNAAVALDQACVRATTTHQNMTASNMTASSTLSPSPSLGRMATTKETLRASRVPVAQWEGSSLNEVREAAQLVANSTQLRKQIDTYLSQLYQAKSTDAHRTKKSFEDKLAQTAKLNTKIISQIKVIDAELLKLEGERDIVLQKLDDSRRPFDQCKQRLDLRKQRPAREMVRDGVEIALQQQMTHLRDTTMQLEARLRAIEAQQQSLIDARTLLERDQESKSSSYHVDKECLDCAGSDFQSVLEKRRNREKSYVMSYGGTTNVADFQSACGSSVLSTHQRAVRILNRARSAMR